LQSKLVKRTTNGKLTTVLFCNVFYECIEGELAICLLLATFIGDDWMVGLMIIFIEKTIANALDINNTIKKKWGCQMGEILLLQKMSALLWPTQFTNDPH
jgi:hypothetical protein